MALAFVSANELEEKRKQRQEQWDRVRTADQPAECPEEEVDPRSLYEKLESQKEATQAVYDEQKQFKNMIRGIDEEESKFLEEVVDQQMERKTNILKEENALLDEMKTFTKKLSGLDEPSSSSHVPMEKTTTAKATKKTQANILAGAVKRRLRSDDNIPEKRPKSSPDVAQRTMSRLDEDRPAGPDDANSPIDMPDRAYVLGVLPGVGCYDNSSDSDTSSSDSEIDVLNIIRRDANKLRPI